MAETETPPPSGNEPSPQPSSSPSAPSPQPGPSGAPSADTRPPRDLTCILVRRGDHDEASLRALLGRYGDVYLRLRSLDAVSQWQVELFDPQGMPAADPALVHALSTGGKRACFVHVNHQARQAVLHAFENGQQLDGWVGQPADLAPKLKAAVGHTLEALLAADDGTRHGIGSAASATVALVRGRELKVPQGMPTTLGTLFFHDLGEEPSEDRVAIVAIDEKALARAWREVPGRALAERVKALPERAVGPLLGKRASAIATLEKLGDAFPEAAGLRDTDAVELVALTEGYTYGVGATARYLDERFLPLFAIAQSTTPPSAEAIADDDTDLDELPGVLSAMAEILPYSSPEGTLLEMIGDDELRPLPPWVSAGEEHAGSMVLLASDRLRKLLATDQREIAQRVDAFFRAWWKATEDGPLDEKFVAWRRAHDERGQNDVGRFLRTWADWRAAFELGVQNGLTPALVFYGAAK